jgi:AraC-like DNA-binding protein
VRTLTASRVTRDKYLLRPAKRMNNPCSSWILVYSSAPSARGAVDRVRSVAVVPCDHMAGVLTVSEIAERVGYDSVPAFSKAFKRRLGSSPSSWRRRGHVS